MLVEMYLTTSLAFALVYGWLYTEERPVRYIFLVLYLLTLPVAVFSDMYYAVLGQQFMMIAFILIWYAGRSGPVGEI